MTDLSPALEQYLTGGDPQEVLARLGNEHPGLTQIAQLLSLRDRQDVQASVERDEWTRLQEELTQSLNREEELREQVATLKSYAIEVADSAQRLKGEYEIQLQELEAEIRQLTDKNQRAAKGIKHLLKVVAQEQRPPIPQERTDP